MLTCAAFFSRVFIPTVRLAESTFPLELTLIYSIRRRCWSVELLFKEEFGCESSPFSLYNSPVYHPSSEMSTGIESQDGTFKSWKLIQFLSSYLWHGFLSSWIGNLLGAVLLVVPFMVRSDLSQQLLNLKISHLAQIRS